MIEFLEYILKSAVSISLLYVFYLIFLRHETFYGVNRAYLIGAVFVSLLLPFLKIPVLNGINTATYSYVLESVVVKADSFKTAITSHPDFYQMIIIIYLTGAVIFFVQFAFRLIRLLLMVRRLGISSQNGYSIVFTDIKYSPFSFFNVIFVHNEIKKDDADKIIAHESVHVRKHHSFDLLLLELLTCLQWFNPVCWFYRNSLKGIHEFQADMGTLEQGVDKLAYQKLLLTQALGVGTLSLSNSFNQSLLTKMEI